MPTGRPKTAHPSHQVQRIEDLREATRQRNDAARRLDAADHALMVSLDRAQRAGIPYHILTGEVPAEVAATESTLRRKVAKHRHRFPRLAGLDS